MTTPKDALSAGHSHGVHSDPEHLHGGHAHAAGAHPGHGVEVERGFVPSPGPFEPTNSALGRGAGKGKVLFLDLPSGIAGDMTLAALLDLGLPPAVVTEAIGALGLDGVELRVDHGYVGAIGCTHVEVLFAAQGIERDFGQIRRLIEQSSLDSEVRELSLSTFERLARAEAQVHRTEVERVHFHEVGAVDAIVDIVGSAALFCHLGARVVASPVPLGRGFVDCRHGRLPLPAPATLLCLTGVPTVPSGLEVELVTPTGAAILATVAEEFADWFPVIPERVGWGAGTRGLSDRPNAARAVLGREAPSRPRPTHVLLEANLDDMTGEAVAFAMDRVFAAGALDVWTVPVTMKKSRPGVVFSALSEPATQGHVARAMLEHTSTLGVRQHWVHRDELSREMRTVETKWGPVRVKLSGDVDAPASRKAKPEFDDCARIAEREGLSLGVVFEAALRALDR